MFKKTLVYNSQSHLTPTITTVSLLVVLNQYMTVSGVSDIIFVFLVTAEVNVCFLSSNFFIYYIKKSFSSGHHYPAKHAVDDNLSINIKSVFTVF
jgi:hypothetical protein